MNRNDLIKRINQLEDYEIGKTVRCAFCEDDNFDEDIANSIYNGLLTCETERDLKMFERGIVALCGYSINTILSLTEKRLNKK